MTRSTILFVKYAKIRCFLVINIDSKLNNSLFRYYAMDRDQRHERIKIAYEGLVQGTGDKVSAGDLVSFVQEQYLSGITDEFLKPIIVDEAGLIEDGDTLLFFDFRSDRMRQIVEAFGVQKHFETEVAPENISITTLTKYKEEFPFPNLFPPRSNEDTLAEWLSKSGVKQYHCAGQYNFFLSNKTNSTIQVKSNESCDIIQFRVLPLNLKFKAKIKGKCFALKAKIIYYLGKRQLYFWNKLTPMSFICIFHVFNIPPYIT